MRNVEMTGLTENTLTTERKYTGKIISVVGIIAFGESASALRIALRKDPRASFTVIDEGVKDDGGWAYTFKNVVVFGRVEFIDDQAEAIEICRRLSRRFTQNEKYIEDEIKNFGALVKVFALVPEHITGKRVHEA